MGGRRLTPGQSIKALREAIAIIRELWNTETKGGTRVAGDFYSVAGAKRGPKPAHDIGVWIGAYGPKMLGLTGELGDGWLPSLGYLKQGPEALRGMNRLIDEGAEKAGREPSAVRRMLNIHGRFGDRNQGLLNGPPEQWTEELAGLNADYGISGFNQAADDAETTRTFAREVAPAARELISGR